MKGLIRLLRILKANDPVDLENKPRFEALQDRIMAAVAVTPQVEPVAVPMRPSLGARLKQASLIAMPRFDYALGIALLVLGLWVGQSFSVTGDSRQVVVAQTQNEQQISVIAMASPWQGWIEEGE
ncbi:MAG: hypothetical protein AB7E52_01840 [Bdellovibrionales bacterium]